ncbi:MAG: esterase family protein [Bacteroidetes bacterium]|nr:esterase family protein [Bacteroidota bacterium]
MTSITKYYSMTKTIILSFILFLSIEIFPQDTLLINADYIPHTDTTLVFYPKDYKPETSYPLLFMLHGYSGNYEQWNDITNLDSVATKDEFIIVCPDGFYDSWYVDSPMKKNSQYETFFFKNLVPEIFKKYNIDKKDIFITGLSMGGHGAMYLFLKHPDFFRSAGSTSGILDITAFPNNWEMPKVFGSYTLHQKRWEKYSDIYLLKSFKDKNKKIIVDCGTEDFSFKVNQAFADSCKAIGIQIDFITGPGKHEHKYWSNSIAKHFAFFKNIIDNEEK